MATNPTTFSLESHQATPRTPLSGTYLLIEIKRLLRNRRTLVFTLFMPAVFYLIFGLSNSSEPLNNPGNDTYAEYILISLTVYAALISATASGTQVAVERSQGWSRQLRLTPISPAAYIATKAIAALTMSLIAVIVQLAFGTIFGARLGLTDLLVGGLVAWLGSLTFAALGLFVGYLMPSENVMQVLGAVVSILAMLGGLFMPVEIMGDTFKAIAEWTPAYGIGNMARSHLVGDWNWLWLVNTFGWLLVFSVGAMLAFRRDTQRV
ncbi:ABC transporter permease [Micrococcales bacterium 31B]|nr:ABC transporter permease [Micrococcales bacterium 31B]